jgi:hypothetical protein
MLARVRDENAQDAAASSARHVTVACRPPRKRPSPRSGLTTRPGRTAQAATSVGGERFSHADQEPKSEANLRRVCQYLQGAFPIAAHPLDGAQVAVMALGVIHQSAQRAEAERPQVQRRCKELRRMVALDPAAPAHQQRQARSVALREAAFAEALDLLCECWSGTAFT